MLCVTVVIGLILLAPTHLWRFFEFSPLRVADIGV